MTNIGRCAILALLLAAASFATAAADGAEGSADSAGSKPAPIPIPAFMQWLADNGVEHVPLSITDLGRGLGRLGIFAKERVPVRALLLLFCALADGGARAGRHGPVQHPERDCDDG